MEVASIIIADIVKATDKAGGISPEIWEVSPDVYLAAYQEVRERRDAEGKPFLSAPIDRPNFLLAGIPVVVKCP
jgi:hypothetical protein